MTRITIIGTGYVGLVTGVCLAKMGNTITCLDIDREKIHSLQKGKIPFFEPGLEEATIEETSAGRLSFTSSYESAIPDAEICFLALPTPSAEDGSCDMRYIFSAVKQIAQLMSENLVIVNKSTVPVGTTEKVREILRKETNLPCHVISNPEFLKEGSALTDALDPDRILIGVDSPYAESVMKKLYAPFIDRILMMDIASCELAKYAANAMLATRLSFMNHLSILCEKVGANIDSIQQAIGKDPRIGSHYLRAGIGFGGSCLPKDVRALKETFIHLGLSSEFFENILKINTEQQEHFIKNIVGHFGNLSGKRLAIWGLSFKPDTDDLREAPSLYLIQKCLQQGAILRLYDPAAIDKAKQIFRNENNIQYCKDPYDAAMDTDAILLLTEWKEFVQIDFAKLGKIVREKTLFDGRNVFDRYLLETQGFSYFGIGKPLHTELVPLC